MLLQVLCMWYYHSMQAHRHFWFCKMQSDKKHNIVVRLPFLPKPVAVTAEMDCAETTCSYGIMMYSWRVAAQGIGCARRS